MHDAKLRCRKGCIVAVSVLGMSAWVKITRAITFATISCILLAANDVSAKAPNRIALVIGNDNYLNLPENAQLKNAVNDAKVIRDALKRLNFKVKYGENLTREEFEDHLFEFTGQIVEGDIAFFFYAGHGVGIKGGNYFLPSDVKPPRSNRKQEEDRMIKKSIAEVDVIRGMRDAGARVAIAVLDACRNNPLESGEGRSIGASRGLQRVAASRGVFSLYLAGYNEVALDRLPGEQGGVNSVFTRIFVKTMMQSGLTLSEIARKTINKVDSLASKAGAKQTPAYYDQIVGNPVYLAGRAIESIKGNTSSSTGGGDAAADPKPIAPSSVNPNFELTFWDSVKGSKDPNVLKQYLAQFPLAFTPDWHRSKLKSWNAKSKKATAPLSIASRKTISGTR